MEAALFRTAAHTCPIWEKWLPKLYESASRDLHLSELGQGRLNQPHWDSPPIVATLANAWKKVFPDHGGTCGSNADSEIAESIRKLGIPRPYPGHPKFKQLQKIAYSSKIGFRFPELVVSLILRRVCIVLAMPDLSNLHIEEAFCIMRKEFNKHSNMSIFKTWIHAWTTSHRIHETPEAPCIFKCGTQDAKDCMIHYFSTCSAFRQILSDIESSEDSPWPTPWAFDIFNSLGLENPSFRSLCCVASMFHAYHSVKHLRALGNESFSREFISAEFTGHFLASVRDLRSRSASGHRNFEEP